MKSATLITKAGTATALYFENEEDDVILEHYDDGSYLIDNDLNMANEVAWLAENQAALKHKKVLGDKIRLEAEKESAEKNMSLMTDVQQHQVRIQIDAEKYARSYEESPIARLK